MAGVDVLIQAQQQSLAFVLDKDADLALRCFPGLGQVQLRCLAVGRHLSQAWHAHHAAIDATIGGTTPSGPVAALGAR